MQPVNPNLVFNYYAIPYIGLNVYLLYTEPVLIHFIPLLGAVWL